MNKKALKVAQAFIAEQIYVASAAEREVERLLMALLPGTPFAHKVHIVGGYVRDQYIREITKDKSIEPKDLDAVVEMKDGAKKISLFIKEKFGKSVSTPLQMSNYPIWQITFKENIDYQNESFKTKGAVIEFADTMREKFTDPDSRQRETEYAPLKEDIERRDFTVNMLLKDLTTGEITDLTGTSKRDIEKGVLKHIDNVMLSKRFKEDPLRLLRLVRFQAINGWDIPMSVLRIAKKNAHRIKIVSNERIRDELQKTMKKGVLNKAIGLMKAIGLLKYILPEVEELRGVEQGEKYHQEGDVYKHTLMVLEKAKPGIENQMAALLHDIGKPATQQVLPNKTTFIDHQHAGAEIAKALMKRLKFDKKTSDKVVSLVKRHMDPLFKLKTKEKNLRKYIREVGDETIKSILDLARADELGRLPPKNEIPDLIKRIKEIQDAPIKVQKKPVLTGKEIMELLKMKSGPEVGEVKNFLLDTQDEYAAEKKELTKETAEKLLLKKFKK